MNWLAFLIFLALLLVLEVCFRYVYRKRPDTIVVDTKEKIKDPVVTASLPHKYLGIFGMLWICFLIINTLTSVKTFTLFGLMFSVGALTYPVTYIFADIFTEIYGFRVSRKIIWTGFIGFFLISLIGYLYSLIPSDPSFTQAQNEAFNLIFRSSPIVVLIGLCSFPLGEFTNSTIVAKMKIFTKGKKEDLRFILSTFFGQTVDNTIFFVGAYLAVGWYSPQTIPVLIFSTVMFCTLWEILAIPITRRVIRAIKELEGIDTYDHGTNFNPFSLKG
jgi:uncharacterized integral membrane protein (TIGR00697 family)